MGQGGACQVMCSHGKYVCGVPEGHDGASKEYCGVAQLGRARVVRGTSSREWYMEDY